MADKTGYIGRNPNDSAVTVARQFFTASGVTTTFTFASGYLTGYLDVYVDGVKRRVADEFTATDGSTFDVLQGGVSAGSTVEAVAYKAFNAAAISGDITGNFDVSGNSTLGGSLSVTGGTTLSNINVTGIATLGAGTTVAFANTAFNLSGTPDISVDLLSAVDINVSGAATIGGVLTYEDVTNIDSVGIVTARTGVEVTANGLVVNAGVSTFAADVSIADKIVHTGDTNTAIRFPSADTITAETAGVERLRIDSNGDVGLVGIATATGLVVVAGSGVYAGHTGVVTAVTFDGNVSGGASGDFTIEDKIVHSGDTNTAIRFPAADTFTVETAGSEAIRVNSSGSFGINETSPQQKLHVGGDVEIGFASPTDAARQIIFDANRSSADATIANINWQWNSTSVAQIRGITGADTTNKDDAHLAFFTAAAGSLVERLRITSGGVLLAGATASVGEGGTPADLNSTEIGRGYINIARDDTAAADHILFGKNGSVASSIGTDTTNTLVFKIGTTERARFDSSGRFGINQSSPQRILHIGESGTAEANLRIQGGADYFEFRVKDSDNALTIHRNIAGGGSNEDLRINSSGDVLPGGDDSQDLGSTSKRWANIYSADLQLSNEGKSNDVDGTWGQYTIQEGENDLFLLNRRNGKTYKFVLEEVN